METSVKTWGQALDYTFQTRHTWRHGAGAKPAAINCGHFTRLRGRSLPVAKIAPALMSQVCIELEVRVRVMRRLIVSLVPSLRSSIIVPLMNSFLRPLDSDVVRKAPIA